MAHLFTFQTARFKPGDERPNPINPIGGEAVLLWLAAALTSQGFETGEPDTEDWGWYTHVKANGRTYLLGASGEWPDSGAATEWSVQLELHRSLRERLTGANKLTEHDPVSLAIESMLRAHADVSGLAVDRAA